MKNNFLLTLTIFLTLSGNAYSAPENIITGERFITDIRIWSSDYYAPEYSDTVRITLDFGFTEENCNYAYFSTKDGLNQSIYSAALSAQAQKSKIEIVINNNIKIADWCKLESLTVK